MRIHTALLNPVVAACSLGVIRAQDAYAADPTPFNRSRMVSEEIRLKSILKTLVG